MQLHQFLYLQLDIKFPFIFLKSGLEKLHTVECCAECVQAVGHPYFVAHYSFILFLFSF